MDSEEGLFLFWIAIGVGLTLIILIYRFVNHIIWKIRFRRSLRRLKRSMAAATAQMSMLMIETGNAAEAIQKCFNTMMNVFGEEMGYLTGKWISKNMKKIIKETKKNGRSTKGDHKINDRKKVHPMEHNKN